MHKLKRIKLFIGCYLLVLFVVACNGNRTSNAVFSDEEESRLHYDSSAYFPFICVIDTPVCTDSACYGMYKGVEFVGDEYIQRLGLNGNDVAHQYSNKIAEYVGRKLKQLYRDSLYSKVNFKGIRMSTVGMGDDDDYVEYKIYIPLVRVPKHMAMTAFDHCGGWGHKPDLKNRLRKLIHHPSRIVKNKRVWVSRLTKTKEGLEEYWIQWQHKDF